MPLGVKYGKWEEDDMSHALDSVRNGDMGVNEAARTYDVPVAEVSVSGLSHDTQAPGKKSVATTSRTDSEPLPADASTLQTTVQASLSEISPIPTKISIGKGSNKAQKTILITSSPHKQILEEGVKKTKGRRGTAVNQTSGPEKTVNAKLSSSPSANIKSKEDSWFCAICCDDFREDMIQCLSCKQWVHEKCVGVRKGIKVYYCEKCN